ncbi:MAG TPA: FHA domain-containing protein [Acidobacteriota bacterium]|nr:FHA domain-containing protein [Acidobacteriota bacterium]
MFWIIVVLVFAGVFVAFIVIARKGRELRRSQPLPPPANAAFLRWTEDGKNFEQEVQTPFYLGRKADNNLVINGTRAEYEVCIFYHNERFAFQTLDRAGEVLINDEEKLAGYLADGDVLKIGNRELLFRCY